MGIGPLIFFLINYLSIQGRQWVNDVGGFMNLIEIYFGVCSTVSVVLLMSSQLTSVRRVLNEKNSRSISGWMLAGNIFCATCWTVYSFLIMNPYFIAANAIGDVACLAQLAVKLWFHPKRSDKHVATVNEEIEKSITVRRRSVPGRDV
jgi:uncharacterized protein with PQ loop repeat